MSEQTKWFFNGESVLDEHGRNVCTKQNGHLIAAAPDLLAFARSIAEDHDDCVSGGFKRAARELIAKAIG